MPTALAKLLDGTRAMVVIQGAKTVEMIYNTSGWMPLDGKATTGQYRFEPKDHTCFSWFTNDELIFATYIDQQITEQPLTRPAELKQLHIPKTLVSVLLNDW